MNAKVAFILNINEVQIVKLMLINQYYPISFIWFSYICNDEKSDKTNIFSDIRSQP
jgi:hypothetical protein